MRARKSKQQNVDAHSSRQCDVAAIDYAKSGMCQKVLLISGGAP